MRIAFDYQIFGLQVYGGISRYAYELAVRLASIYGQKVVVVAPLYVNKYLVNAPPVLDVKGLAVPQLPKTRKIYTFVNQLLSQLLVRSFRPDIVHETYYSIRKRVPSNSKVILTVYDMIHERFSDNFSETDRTSVEKALAVSLADHIICISEQTKRDLIEILGVEASKISVVYLGFSLISQDKSVTITDGQSHPFLLYVGNREGHKNFDRLLLAYAASTKLKNDFDLICFGGGAFTNNEDALFQKLGVDGRVKQVSGDDAVLAGYYKAAKVFIYPSLYEGFGIPPLEAMSLGCPVVCSNVSSIPEVVGEAGEMFDPYDTNSIREVIERVVSDSQLQEILINRGRERVKLFSWERCAQETLDVYRKVLV